MLTSIVALLPSILPIVMFFINLFVKDQATRDANKKAFLDAISAHHDDALAYAQERHDAWDQRRALIELANQLDSSAVPKDPQQK